MQAPRKRRQPLEIEVDDGRKVRKRKAFGSAKKGAFGRALIGEAGGGVSALSRGLADLGMLLGDTQTCSFDPVEPPLFLKPCHKPQAGGAGGRVFLNPAISRTIPHARLGARQHKRMFTSKLDYAKRRSVDPSLARIAHSRARKRTGSGAKRTSRQPSSSQAFSVCLAREKNRTCLKMGRWGGRIGDGDG